MSDRLQIRRVRNGWIVETVDYQQMGTCGPQDVFTTPKDLAAFVENWSRTQELEKEKRILLAGAATGGKMEGETT